MSQPLMISSLSSTPEYAGSELGATQWFEIAQDRIALFGRASGDTRWIHLDPARAAHESPWQSTIADGYLLLSLVPGLLARLIVLQGWSTAINTGVDRCEFPGVVTAGSRVRMGARLARVRVLPGQGCRLGFDIWFDVEGGQTPACRARVNYAYFT